MTVNQSADEVLEIDQAISASDLEDPYPPPVTRWFLSAEQLRPASFALWRIEDRQASEV
ncbi:hypothetical protein [Rhodococcus sp. JT-3]|uniref:hypothetical protein n=1 Tax=Rhodococcus sp. JT-3 TaxID=1973213 RepID=UPI001303E28F|nr:hypothetical protein [Rhodococcus sp. JT-3]